MDGRLHLEKSRISKEAVNPYYGYEIPNHERLGLDENKIYKMYRPASELEKAAKTFNRIQILKRHEPVFSSDSKKDLIIGTTGSEARFESPYLVNSLSFWDDEGIGSIEAADNGLGGAKQLSAGYAYTPVMQSGEFDGQQYDGIMTNIIGNHIALVESGRAGSDVKVADNNIFNDKSGVIHSMNEEAEQKKEHAIEEVEELAKLATDAGEADVVHLLKMKGLDDEEIAHIVRILKEDKTSKDEEVKHCVIEDEDKDEKRDVEKDDREEKDVKKALDSFEKRLRAEFRELEKAKDVVRPLVDNIRNVDKAEEVYRLALDSQSIKHSDIKELSALEALCKLAIKSNAVPEKIYNSALGMDEDKIAELLPFTKRIKIQ